MDIVVVNYKTPDDLRKFWDSLQRYPPTVRSTLTVVDVESDVVHTGRPWHWGDSTIISVPDNIGYARACNLAANGGDHDVIAFFNADIEITPGSLTACYRALIDNADWAVLGPCQVDLRNRIRHAGIFGTLETPMHRGWNDVNRGQYGDIRDAVSVSGSAYFIKRTVWDELTSCPLYRQIAPDSMGAFLPTPHYYEETWASYHAKAHGHRVIYYGQATLVHKWHRASPIGGWAERQMPISRRIFREACDAHGIAHD